MKSKVYFVQVADAENINEVNKKLSQLLAKSNVLACVKEGHKPVIKLHFGEEGTTGYVRPDHLRFICDEIVKKRATPFLSDANTLYRGKRLNSEDHLNTAMSHGFTKQAVGVDVFIPNDTKKDEIASVQIDQRHIKTAKVGRCYIEADSILAVTHFKGHGLTGFGGTLQKYRYGLCDEGRKTCSAQ